MEMEFIILMMKVLQINCLPSNKIQGQSCKHKGEIEKEIQLLSLSRNSISERSKSSIAFEAVKSHGRGEKTKKCDNDTNFFIFKVLKLLEI